jgi:hypothetical protein
MSKTKEEKVDVTKVPTYEVPGAFDILVVPKFKLRVSVLSPDGTVTEIQPVEAPKKAD